MNGTAAPLVSVIIPCRNEENYIRKVIENLLHQDFPKEQMEIIFLDGRSTDRTREIIQEYAGSSGNIRLLDNAAGVVPHALNEGIRNSTGEVIIRMDAHSDYPVDYISQLVFHLQHLNADNVGGMWITMPGADTVTAKAIAVALAHPFGIGNARYRLGANEPIEVDTVPFGCYRIDVFGRIGLFDEQLIRNQDDEFNARLKKAGGRIFLIPSVKILYYARPTLTKLSKMYYQYGLFKPLVNIKLGAPATVRQLVPPLFVFAVFLLAIASVLSGSALILFALLIGTYLFFDFCFSFLLAFRSQFRFLLLLPIVFPVIHFSYGTGYLSGLIKYTILGKQHSTDPVHFDISR